MFRNEDRQKYAHLPLVPETVLRKRHDLEAVARQRAANRAAKETRDALTKHVVTHGDRSSLRTKVLKPETIVARAMSRRNHKKRFDRVQIKGMQKRASDQPRYKIHQVQVEVENADDNPQAEPKTVTKEIRYQSNSVGADFVFCIRIRNGDDCPKAIRHILSKRFRLHKPFQGVFIRYTAENRRLLHMVEPFVIYGQPGPAMVSDLIVRRGFGCVLGEVEGRKKMVRVPLSDNLLIEKELGEKHGIICVEDLVHEICHPGDSFQAASNFLWTFHLTDAKSKYERRILRIKDGKQYGDQGEAIQEYIKTVL